MLIEIVFLQDTYDPLYLSKMDRAKCEKGTRRYDNYVPHLKVFKAGIHIVSVHKVNLSYTIYRVSTKIWI